MTDRPNERTDLTCPECGADMVLRESRYGPFYGCSRYPDCEVAHGAHPDGAPLGEPADAETRDARHGAHEAFDPLWEHAERLDCYDLPTDPEKRKQAIKNIRGAARNRAYWWLAEQMELCRDECHIAAFDREQCEEAVGHARRAQRNGGARFIRAWAKRKHAAEAERDLEEMHVTRDPRRRSDG